jgi:hypothetical protein
VCITSEWASPREVGYREDFAFGIEKLWNLGIFGIKSHDNIKLFEMDFADPSQRPAKRRRFFEESSPEDNSFSQHEVEDEIHSSLVEDSIFVESQNDRESTAPSHKDINVLPLRSNEVENLSTGFDNDAFEAIIGEPVAPSVLRKLKEVSAGDTHRGKSGRG